MEKLTRNEMEINEKVILTNNNKPESKILAILKNYPKVFKELKISTVRDLHKKSVDKNEVYEYLEKNEKKIINSFFDLVKLFPPEVSDALVSLDVKDRDEMLKLSDKELKRKFTSYGLEKNVITKSIKKFEYLKKVGSSKEENEISLLVKGLDKQQIKQLKNVGVETLYDWSIVRPANVESEVSNKLDAYARLNQLDIDIDVTQNLIDKAKIRSVSQLSEMSKKNLIKLSKQIGLTKSEVFTLAADARKTNEINKAILFATKDPTNVNDGFNVREEWFFEPIIDLDDIVKKCFTCPDDISVFSCFAYLIYLIQLTGKSLAVLSKTLDLDFSKLNADNLNEISDKPQIACEKISVCEQMTRALQDYLDELKRDSNFEAEFANYTYLSYQAWKSNKMALHYPELHALWRGDVLTGEIGALSNGSFLNNPVNTHAHLAEQLANVKSTLSAARVFPFDENEDLFLQQVAINPTEFSNAEQFRKVHKDHFTDFTNGLKVIEQILSADQKVLEAHESMQVDDSGNSIFHLNQALAHLDEMVDLTFSSSSIWRNISDQGGQPYQSLIELRPEQRAEVSKSLFNELTREEKPLFIPRNNDIVIQGLPNDGSISIENSWRSAGAFRDRNGRLEKYSPATVNSFVKYVGPPEQDFSRFTNYSLSADLQLEKEIENGDVIALATHWETARNSSLPRTGYMLAITQETNEPEDGGLLEPLFDFLFSDDDVIKTKQALSLRKIEEDANGNIKFRLLGNPVQIGFQSFGGESLNSTNQDNWLLRIDRVYPLELKVVGNRISGELKVSENKTVKVTATDSSYPAGTFGFFGSNQTQFTLSNIKFDLEGANEGFPPFHASRRLNNRNQLNDQIYVNHRQQGSGMAIGDLAEIELTSISNQFNLKPLTGLRTLGANNQPLALLFDRDKRFIKLNLLDDLLEQCLSAAFYMRYAVIPIKLAEAFALQGNYKQAIDHIKLVYDDFSTIENQREIYPYLNRLVNVFDFIPSADAKLMRLRLGDNYLKQADILFRKNTSKSKYEAKQLLEKVLLLHNEKNRCECDASIGEVTETVLKSIFDLNDLVINTNIGQFLNIIKLNYQKSMPVDIVGIIEDNFKKGISQKEFDEAIKLTYKQLKESEVKYRTALQKNTTVASMRSHSRALIDEIEIRASSIKGSSSVRKNLNQQIKRKNYLELDHISSPLVDYIDLSFCIPQNPIVLQQTKQACLMLDLVENCLNIIGFTDDFIPAQRFEHLFALASNFTDSAYSVERDVLSFRRLLEDEVIGFINAENNVTLNNASVSLEALNIEHAEGDIILSELQKNQTQISFNHFDDLITNGLSGYEELALGAATATTVFSGMAAAGGIISAGATAVGIGTSATGNPAGIAIAAAGIAGTLLGGAQGLASFSSSVSNLATMQGGFQRREQEWQYNLALNDVGVDIATEGVKQAIKRLDIVQRQYEIAALKRDFAMDTLSFLENKFFNKEMLTWMLRLSRDQYRVRLNYAITAAFMAEKALAFELLSPSLKAVRFDYFEPRRDGLLGATQLQTDLKSLQVTKLNTEKRKLQLSKTISLAELAPTELQNFKSTGVLPFSTLLNWFDKDFPGHYQRLIKKVSVSVLALVPPHKGIKATLRNTGLSKVITGPPFSQGFEQKIIKRPPEVIALTSAFESSGIIDLSYQNEFLSPFEGSGVETDWLLEMPKASNSFDYRTIADVYIKIDYVASHSDIYAESVKLNLKRVETNGIPLNTRLQFPNAWYHFQNDTVAANESRKLSINIPEAFIPIQYTKTDDAKVKHVAVMLQGDFSGLTTAQKNKLKKSVSIEHDVLRLASQTDSTTVPPVIGFKTTTLNVDTGALLLSTRDPNNIAATTISNINPVGDWSIHVDEIDLGGGVNIIDKINDILLIVTTEGDVDWG